MARFNAARRQLHVFRAQRLFDIAHGEFVGSQLHPIYPDAHSVTLTAADANLRHPIDDGKPVNQIAFGVIGELRRGHFLAGEIQPHDHVFVGVDLGHIGQIGFIGQTVEHPRYPVAHIVGGGVYVTRHVEFDGDF